MEEDANLSERGNAGWPDEEEAVVSSEQENNKALARRFLEGSPRRRSGRRSTRGRPQTSQTAACCLAKAQAGRSDTASSDRIPCRILVR